MTENTEIKTEQENSKIQFSDPGPRCSYNLYGYDNSKDDYKNIINQTNIRSSTIENGFKAALSIGDFGTQLGQPDQVIICSFIGGNNIEDVIFMNKKDEDTTKELLEWTDQEEYWTCKKCDKNIMESVYHQGKYYKAESHKKYCNSTKEKHKHKLIPDYNTKHVKDKCCFRCGDISHYIVDCKNPNI